MKKRLPLLAYNAILILVILGFVTIAFYLLEGLILPSTIPHWSFLPLFVFSMRFIIEKLSKYGPERLERKRFSNISSMPIRDKLIFWIGTGMFVIGSIVEGALLKSVDFLVGLLLLILNYLIWLGIQYISSPNLRDEINFH